VSSAVRPITGTNRSPEGRLDHRDRQREYRRRLIARRVTDQGSDAGIGFSSLALPRPPLPDRCVSEVVCRIHGSAGMLIDPFSGREMLDPEKLATIRRLYYAEHWNIGTIAADLGVHRDTVRAAIETDPLHRPRRLRVSRLGLGPLPSVAERPEPLLLLWVHLRLARFRRAPEP